MDERVQRKQRALIDRWRTILSLRHFSHLSGLIVTAFENLSQLEMNVKYSVCVCVSVSDREKVAD